DLRNSTIISPIDGLVLSRDVNVGDAVSSILVLGSQATLIMTLGDISEVYVQGKVDEADIGKVYLNQQARIVVESFKDNAGLLVQVNFADVGLVHFTLDVNFADIAEGHDQRGLGAENEYRTYGIADIDVARKNQAIDGADDGGIAQI